MGMLDTVLVAEQIGRVVAPGPFVASVVMAPIALADAGSPMQQAELLPKLADGSLVIAVAIAEFAAGARDGAGIESRDGRVSGSLLFALDCASADLFLVADRHRRLHLIDRNAAGLTITLLDTVDRTRSVGKLDLVNVAAEPLGQTQPAPSPACATRAGSCSPPIRSALRGA